MKGVVVIEDASARTGSGRSDRPDALQNVANRPIARHVLDALGSAGVDEVVVASSAGSAGDVRTCFEAGESVGGPHLRFVSGRASLDVDGALALAAPIVDGAPCILHVGSGLLNEPLEPVIARMQGTWPDVVLMMHKGETGVGRLTLVPDGHPSPAALDRAANNLGVAGVCLFGPDGLARAGRESSTPGNSSGLKTLADRLVDHGGSVDVLRVNGWRQYGGDPLDLLELNRIALDYLESDPVQRQAPGNRIEGRVRIHEHACVRSSVIVGPTVIGPGAQVCDAYIGPYTSIGAGAVVEGAEIERSIVDVGASITHVGGRLVSSVVGRGARVSRDFSLPRALRLRIGDGGEVALC